MTDAQLKNSIYFTADEDKAFLKLGEELRTVFVEGDSIGIKMHFGEPGNKTALRPELVKRVVEAVKSVGAKPFLFDTPVIYNSPRNTEEGYLKAAASRGFSEKTMGCPVIISNSSVPRIGKAMTYNVSKVLADSDGVLILSHIKGHICCGFGGAIKNLGMGGQSKETKGAIHKAGEPEYVGGCTLCGECAKACPNDHIRYGEDRPYFDKNWCCGCSNCVIACKFDALKTRSGYTFDFLLSEAAAMAYKTYKRSYCMNVINNITAHCDCESDPGEVILDDVGFVLGKDIVAVDMASMELVNEKAGDDFFKKVNKKSPSLHIKEAEGLGMGKTSYSLTRI